MPRHVAFLRVISLALPLIKGTATVIRQQGLDVFAVLTLRELEPPGEVILIPQ